jgi:hypothetical protein
MKILAKGRFKYSDQIFLPVRIVERDFWPGTGDYEDPEDIREDQLGIFFEMEFSSSPDGIFNRSAGYFKTLEDAKERAKELNLNIIWET